MYEIDKISYFSSAKIFAIIGIILGIPIAILFSLLIQLGVSDISYLEGLTYTILPTTLILIPLTLGILGLVLGLIFGFVFNLLSKFIGGIKIEIKER